MKQYHDLLRTIKQKGTYKGPAREGMIGSTSYFGYQARYDLSEGFPTVTTKKLYWKGVVVELLWFLKGDTNIKFLDEHNVVKMWHEDAYNYYCKLAKSNTKEVDNILQHVSAELNTRTPEKGKHDSFSIMTFEEFCKKIKETSREDLPKYQNYTLGDCGYQYGKTWRYWDKYYNEIGGPDDGSAASCHDIVDQIANVIKSIKTNPEGRRHLVSSIDPANSENLALYWCHAFFQFNCRKLTLDERLNIMRKRTVNGTVDHDNKHHKFLDYHNIPQYYLDCQMYQRSGDTFLGVPLNIASYALLTHIIAAICNMVPGEFIHTLGDAHIYDNHLEQVDLQLSRQTLALPKLEFSSEFKQMISNLQKIEDIDDFVQVSVEAFNLYSLEDFILEDYQHCGEIKGELTTGMKK